MPRRKISDSWLAEYMRWTEKHESPELFHIWTAFTVVAASLGRKVYLVRRSIKTYPNLYTLFVGPSGVGKTQAMLKGLDILKASKVPPEMSAQKTSPEALLEDLDSYTDAIQEGEKVKWVTKPALIFTSEFPVFFGRRGQREEMANLLTELWDCPEGKWEYKILSRPPNVLHDPVVSMLGGSTPLGLRLTLTSESLEGGFIQRTIVVFDNRPRLIRETSDWSEDVKKELHPGLVADLTRIQSLSGEFTATPEAQLFYDDWHDAYKHALVAGDEDVVRKDVLIHKLSMLLCVMEGDAMLLERRHYEMAEEFATQVDHNRERALAVMGGTEDSLIMDRILAVIKRNSPIPRYQLIKKCWNLGVKAKDLNEMLGTLMEAKMVGVAPLQEGPGTIYTFLSEEPDFPTDAPEESTS